MNANVGNPNLLILLWLVPAVAVWWLTALKRRERALERFMSAALQAKLAPANDGRRQRWQIGLMTAGLALAIIAAARPQWGQREEKVFQRGRDLVVALDVSRSMLANDVRPNRLSRAKTDLIDLVQELRGDRAALLAFRRKATLLCPLTTDYAFFRQALDAASPDAAPRGETDIGAAIRAAMDAFDSEGGAHKAIILISDGEDLAGDARAAAEEAARRGVVIFTVGFGSTGGSTVPDPDQATGHAVYQDTPVVSRLNNETLNEIATLTKGAYIPVGTATMADTTLGTLYRDHLRAIAAQDLEETLQQRFVDRFQWFLLPALLCMFAAAALSRGRLAMARSGSTPKPAPASRRPAQARAVSLLALSLLATAARTSAQTNTAPPTDSASAAVTDTNAPAMTVPPGREGARLAQGLFTRGEHAAAATAYLTAARSAPDEAAADYRYNAAVAYYRAGQFEDAARVLRELDLASRTDDARISEGLGAALFSAADAIAGDDAEALRRRADLTRESADALRVAARAAPQDRTADAARNAAVAIGALRERNESAHIAEVLGQYEKMDAGKLATLMLQTQHEVLAGALAASTNQSPSRIAEHEALAARQRDNVDRWIALKGKLMQAPLPDDATGQVTRAMLESIVEKTRDVMRETAEQLRDVNPDALQTARASESAFYPLWKATAAHADILQQDLRRQTNTIAATTGQADATLATPELEQREALALTRLFQERFEQQVPETTPTAGVGPLGANVPLNATAPSAAGAGDEAAVTNRAAILERTAQATAVQSAALDLLATDRDASLAQQQFAYQILKEIEAMLPKSSSSSPQPQPQDSPPEQNPEPQDQQQPQEQPPEPESQPEQPPQEPQQEQEAQPASGETPKTDEQVERVLERALEREREHEENKRNRMQQAPLSPVERDW
jgi:Ca-activated chloride channel family protein